MINNKISSKIGENRKNISDISRETGLSRGTLTSLYYNNSKAISFKTLDTLCEYFECDVGELFFREEQ